MRRDLGFDPGFDFKRVYPIFIPSFKQRFVAPRNIVFNRMESDKAKLLIFVVVEMTEVETYKKTLAPKVNESFPWLMTTCVAL